MRPARSRLVLFSAAIAVLAAVLAIVLPAGIASAGSAPAAGNRVWAFSPAAHDHIKADRLVSAGERLGEAAQCPFWGSGSCAAPEAAGAAADAAAAGRGASVAERLAASCGGASFTSATKVLLAGGIAVPIASLKRGEKVLATNIRTGKTQAEPVAAVLVHYDTNRYDLTVKTPHGTAVIHTTTTHLFWDSAARRWVKAATLGRSAHLRTPSGATANVLGGAVSKGPGGWMWDLTVPGDHDFYVDTAAAPVLVHNCGYTPAGGGADFSREEIAQLTYQHVGAGDIAGRPSLEEIQTVLDRGQPVQLPGQNSIQLEYGGGRVIVNEDMPWRSTAYYPGR